jgi:ribose transport system substrate-binding protein
MRVLEIGKSTIIGMMVCLVAGCDQPNATVSALPSTQQAAVVAASPKAAKWIAVIPKHGDGDYWRLIHEGAKQAASELGVRVEWLEPTRQWGQARLIADSIAKHVSGIVIAPDGESWSDVPIRNAEAAGVPVVLIDSDLKNVHVVSTVATDNYRAGVLAGQRMIELLLNQGSVVILRCDKEATGTTERERGFVDTLKGSGVKIINDSYYGHGVVSAARKASRELIRKLDLDRKASVGLFTVSEGDTEGMLAALEEANLAGRFRFIGFDTSDVLLKGLRDCKIECLVAQTPEQIGYLGVKTMVAKTQHEFVDSDIKTDAILVDRDNVGSPEVRAFLSPPSHF